MVQKKYSERETYWQQKVNEYSTTGLTQREFCRRNDISYWSFNSWYRRLTAETEGAGMVEVTSRAVMKQEESTEAFEIILPTGLRVRVPEHFKPEHLALIIETLV